MPASRVAPPSAQAAGAPPPLPQHLQEASARVIANVDAHARMIERRWGTGLLPKIVPIEWMERFQSQKRKFELACFEFDHDGIRKHGEAMLRAYDKLEEIARGEGLGPMPPEQWEFTLKDGSLVILVRNREEMGQIDARDRAAQVWSLDEIVDVIERFPALAKVKDSFPGAEIISLRPSPAAKDALDDALDEVPFG